MPVIPVSGGGLGNFGTIFGGATSPGGVFSMAYPEKRERSASESADRFLASGSSGQWWFGQFVQYGRTFAAGNIGLASSNGSTAGKVVEVFR